MRVVNITGDGQKILGVGYYCGFTVAAGAAATVILYDGTPAGPILETLNLVAAGSIQDCYTPVGPAVQSGQVWVAVTGAPSGSIRVT